MNFPSRDRIHSIVMARSAERQHKLYVPGPAETRAGDDGSNTGPAPRPPKPRIEDALTRGLKRCHEVDARFERATVRYQDPEGTKEKNLLLMLEFGDGRVALFTGGVDPDHDQFLVVEAELLETLDEVVTRARKRK